MPTSSTVILHFGPHKTGTTYIQKTLLNNRSELMQAGVIYPDLFLEDPGHHALPRALGQDTATAVRDLRKFMADLNGETRRVIFSSENLSLLSHAEMVSLRDALAPQTILPIIYLRNRAQSIWSQYQEHVKFGEVKSFSDYVSYLLLLQPDANAIDPLGLALRVGRVFGSVDIVSYDGCVAEFRDLTDPILVAACGASLALPHRLGGRSNVRMAQERVEILRLLNLVHLRRGKKPANFVRAAFLKGLRENSELCAAEALATVAIRQRLTEFPLAELEHFYSKIDAERLRDLSNIGIDVPAFRTDSVSERVVYSYLPDTAILFSSIPQSIASIYNLLELNS
ncbi:hypothetical protein KTN05_13490 [Paracoccus sp. Z118]|uniref:hypothetical protein n=1 Tax=Paracoccus sp. Z118 TaxID=2851017 RepID=UPI001C2BEE3E|nr:hypothetical protein [Paracoccus sp. Z118]MBV0892855.1 hypothetical protein [Paracoccus sp. Z118]